MATRTKSDAPSKTRKSTRTRQSPTNQSASNEAQFQAKEQRDRISKTAREEFGFEQLRPGQQEAVEALLAGRDCLVVMPTGAGKSAIYQIAGAIREGATLVVSPLIALQKDQVDTINSRDRRNAEAVVINSTQRAAETKETAEKIQEGVGRYIFLAPEQLRKQDIIDTLREAGVSLFVVDEAHCISEWGHDFRPDYLQLGAVIEQLGHPVVLAMTATASNSVQSEIIERLGMKRPRKLIHGLNRPNIFMRVDHFETEDEKLAALVRRIHFSSKPGIVYVATRKNAEAIMRELKEQGVEALFYHGGLKASDRDAIQEQFMSGGVEVIVATNAFGMGIDKSDIRFVYHYDIPESLDAYYQEIGRSGRDGESAEAVLFFRSENVGIQKFRTGEGSIETSRVEELLRVIADQEGPVEPSELAEKVDLSDRKLTSAIQLLVDGNALEVLPTGTVKLVDGVDFQEAAEAAEKAHQQHREMRRERLRVAEEYADISACRREYLLRYFGEDFKGPCGYCDNCEVLTSSAGTEVEGGTRREVA